METLADALRDDVNRIDWHLPGKGVAVSMSFDALLEILEQQGRLWPWKGKTEIGGILLGAVEPGDPAWVRIHAVKEVASQHRFGPHYALSKSDTQSFQSEIEAARAEYAAVGFYRTHRRRGLALDADDLLLISELLPGAERVALVLKVRPLRHTVGAFFIADDGQMQRSACQEFIIHRRKRAVRFREPVWAPPAIAEPAPEPVEPEVEPRKPEPNEPLAALARPVPVEAPLFTAATPKRARRRQWWSREPGPLWCSNWVQAPLFVILLAAVFYFGLQFSARQFSRLSATPVEEARDPYALMLTVIEYGDNLHLSWDRQAGAIADAERGEVKIIDGEQSRTIALSAAQLRQASIVYRKVTPRVRFRLEVFLKNRRSVSESWEPER